MNKILATATALGIGLGAGQAVASTADESTEFLFRLGMLQGHLIVGHDLLKAGKPKLAQPHFGHPVRELYDDVKGYLDDNHVPSFEADLIALDTQAAKAPGSAETEAKYQAVIQDLEQARQTVPAAIRDSVPAMIDICSDTIDAAAGEYGESIVKGRIHEIAEYHDSRGFISYVAESIDRLSATHAAPDDTALIGRFKLVLAKAQTIVAPLLPPETPSKSVADYRAVAAEAHAIAKP